MAIETVSRESSRVHRIDRRLLLAAAAAFSAVAVACGTEESTRRAEAEQPGTGPKTAVDRRERIAFHLDGRLLRVEAPHGFGDDFDDLEGLDLAVWGFYCRPRDASERPAHATLPFDYDARELEVDLSHDISDQVAYCYFEAGGGAAEAVGWFLPEDEVFPGDVVGDDPAENERRARDATACASFVEQARIEKTWPGPGQVLAPGVEPTVDVHGYWLGPEIGERRAIFASAQVETEWDDREQPRALTHYFASYQVPDDGCLTDLLPSFEATDLGFHPGRELLVWSMPADSHTAQSYLRDPEVIGPSDGERVTLKNGEEVTVFARSALGLAVLTRTTLVRFQVNGGSMPRREEILELLRPVGE